MRFLEWDFYYKKEGPLCTVARAGFEFFCGSALWGLFPMPRTPRWGVFVEPGLMAGLGLLRWRGCLQHSRNRQRAATERRPSCRRGPEAGIPCGICRMEAHVRVAGIRDYRGGQPCSQYPEGYCNEGPCQRCPDGNADADQQ